MVFHSCRNGDTAFWVLSSTLGSLCLAQGHNVPPMEIEPGTLDSESDALPLSNRAPHDQELIDSAGSEIKYVYM